MHLIMFPGTDTLPSLSPFCTKAICLLQMAGADWQPEITTDVSPMPLGKLPVLRLPDRLIPDSANIEAYLTAQGAEFYPNMSAQERGTAHALVRMVEDSLVLGMAHDRWLDDMVWPDTRALLFSEVPEDMRDAVAEEARAGVRAGLTGHGIARFSPADRQARFDKDLAALETQLGTKPYLFGTSPTGADAAIVPTLDMILQLPAETDLQAALKAKPTLTAYVARARAALYPESIPMATTPLTSAAE